MTPEEFIKKFGLEGAKRVLNDAPYTATHVCIGGLGETMYVGEKHSDFSLSKLHDFIESHELVKTWQLPEGDHDETGIDGARMYLECYACYSTNEEKAKLDRLEKAITDVEACQ